MTLLRSPRSKDWLTIWTILLLISGQGFRYLLGLPIYAVVAALTVVGLTLAFQPTWRTLRPPLLIGCFVVLAAMTFIWSGTRGVTALAVAVLLVTTYIAFVTVRGHSSGQFMVLLYRGLQASLFLGLLFEFVVATIVRRPIHPLANDIARLAADHGTEAKVWWSQNLLFEGGPIQGFVGNRNPFAALALLAGIMAFVMVLEHRVRRFDAIGTLVAAVAVARPDAFCDRHGCAAVCDRAFAFGIRHSQGASSAQAPVLFATLAVTAVAGVLTIKYRQEIFDLLDRSPDATHRADIWEQVVHYAIQRPEGMGLRRLLAGVGRALQVHTRVDGHRRRARPQRVSRRVAPDRTHWHGAVPRDHGVAIRRHVATRGARLARRQLHSRCVVPPRGSARDSRASRSHGRSSRAGGT